MLWKLKFGRPQKFVPRISKIGRRFLIWKKDYNFGFKTEKFWNLGLSINSINPFTAGTGLEKSGRIGRNRNQINK